MGTECIEEMVRQSFDDVPDVDISQINVAPFSQQFAVEDLEMIRTAFTADFVNEELDWTMERLIRCVGFVSLDLVMPALRVCRQMEEVNVQYDVPTAPHSHRIVLVQPAPGSEEVLEEPQAEWMLGMATPIPSDCNMNFLRSRRLEKSSQNRAKVWKFLTDKALVIPSVIMELVPGYSLWDRSIYAESEDLFRFYRMNKDLPAIRKSFLDLIEETAEMLIAVRKSQRRYVKTYGPVCDFSDFRNLFMEYFISEFSMILLERLVSVPSLLELQHMSITVTELQEVPSLPQGFDQGQRELGIKLLRKTVYENVTAFLDEAVVRMNKQRGPAITAVEKSSATDLETDLSDTDSETVSESPENIPQPSEDDCKSTDVDNGGVHVGIRGRIISRASSCSTLSECSTWNPSSFNVGRTQGSQSLSTLSVETIADIALTSNQDSANVTTPVAEKKQWRKSMFTIFKRFKRRVTPSPVQGKPVEEASVATNKTRKPSLRSRVASVFSGLLCCCKGQE